MKYTLPKWVDAKKYWAASPAARVNGLQAMVHMLDHNARIDVPALNASLVGSLAALRGIPDEPPDFIIKGRWLKPSNSRHEELAALERLASAHFASINVDERQRAAEQEKAQQTCEHVFERVPDGVRSRRCQRCGYIHMLEGE